MTIIYDWDGTLTTSQQADYPIMYEKCNCSNKELHERAFAISSDLSVSFLIVFKEILRAHGIPFTNDAVSYGADRVKFNPGVTTFLKYFYEQGIKQFIISQSFTEYIRKSPVSPYCLDVFGTTIKDGVGIVPTADDKVRIIKDLINKYSIVPEEIVYIGDGFSDHSALKYVKQIGGTSIFAYNENLKQDLETLKQFEKEGILDTSFPKDYTYQGALFEYMNEKMKRDKLRRKSI